MGPRTRTRPMQPSEMETMHRSGQQSLPDGPFEPPCDEPAHRGALQGEAPRGEALRHGAARVDNGLCGNQPEGDVEAAFSLGQHCEMLNEHLRAAIEVSPVMRPDSVPYERE